MPVCLLAPAIAGGEGGSLLGPIGTVVGLVGGAALAAATAETPEETPVPGPTAAADATSTRQPTNDEIVDAVAGLGGTVKPHPTKAGEGVVIDFGNGTVVDIRVENHPPLGHHGNVQVWKGGKEVSNSHITPPPAPQPPQAPQPPGN